MEALGLIVFVDLILTAFIISRFIIQCKTDQRIKRIEQKIDELTAMTDCHLDMAKRYYV